MSKDKPGVGDVWQNVTTGDIVQIKYGDTVDIYAWYQVGENIYTYNFDRNIFLRSYKYLGKSKASIEQLFEVENEDAR